LKLFVSEPDVAFAYIMKFPSGEPGEQDPEGSC